MSRSEEWIICARRVEDLFENLLENLKAESGKDPFLPRVVLVGSRGMKGWLARRISEELGIFMNVKIEFLARGLRQALLQNVSQQNVNEWNIPLMAWGLMTLYGRPELRELLSRLVSLPQVVPPVFDESLVGAFFFSAELMDLWATYRPDVLDSSLGGRMPSSLPGGIARQLEAVTKLWKELENLLGVGHLFHLVKQEGMDQPPPWPIHVFGLASLAPLYLKAVQKLATMGAVRFYLLAPLNDHCPSESQILGRIALSFRKYLKIKCDSQQSSEPSSFLQKLQSFLAGENLTAVESFSPDQSFEVHVCAGKFRQVEVVKERLLYLLKHHSELQPSDILVVSPQPEIYEPLVKEIFEQPSAKTENGEATGALPVKLSDSTMPQSAQMLEVLKKLFILSRRRLSARAVGELMQLEPIRQKFFSGIDLELAFQLLREANFFWGGDGSAREQEGLPKEESGTVEFALARLAAGMVASEDDELLFCGETPLAPVPALSQKEARVFGALAHFLRTLTKVLERLGKPDGRDASDWRKCLAECLLDICHWPDSERIYWFEELNQLFQAANVAGFKERLSTQAVQYLVEKNIKATRRMGDMWRQAICVSSLQAERGVPYQVICVLGQEEDRTRDQDFSRLPFPESDCWADGDPQAEQLQIFLDTIFSARRSLIITYSGKEPATGQELFPSTPLQLLLESVAKITNGNFSCIEHEFQPYGEKAPIFQAWAARAAEMMSQGTSNLTNLFVTKKVSSLELPPLEVQELTCQELLAFFKHPAKVFLNKRLKIYLEDKPEPLPEREPVELDNLKKWIVGETILKKMREAACAGKKKEEVQSALEILLRARADLPPGQLGNKFLNKKFDEFSSLFSEEIRAELLRLKTEPVCVPLNIQGQKGETISFSARLEMIEGESTLLYVFHDDFEKPKNLLRVWIDLLALAAATGEEARAKILGKENKELFLPDVGYAKEFLEKMVEVYFQGMRRPLPLPLKAAFKFLEETAKAKEKTEAKEKALRKYLGVLESPHGDRDEYWDFLFPHTIPIEYGEFATLAESLYQPLFVNLVSKKLTAKGGRSKK